MNTDVLRELVKVIQAWKTGERRYSFETRGINIAPINPCLEGELILDIYIRIDGFFSKENKNPIPLYYRKFFQTNDVFHLNPDNVNGDSIRLKGVLEKFTEDTYKKVKDKLKIKENVITIDPLYF